MTTISSPIIVGIFQSENDAKNAIDELRNMGFSNDQIGVATPEGGLTGRNIRDDFVNIGVPADAADYYQQQYNAGNAIVSVRPDGQDQAVIDLFNRYGAGTYNRGAVNRDVDYATTSSNVTQTYDTSTNETVDYSTDAGTKETDVEGKRSLKLHEEQLRAQKQAIEAGEVRLGKDVVTEEKTLNVPTTREEVYIERRPGSGQVSDKPIGEGETIDVPVREEQVTVEKQPVVREEIGLGKRAVQENQQVTYTVRREEAHIERSGDVEIKGDKVDDLTTDKDINA